MPQDCWRPRSLRTIRRPPIDDFVCPSDSPNSGVDEGNNSYPVCLGCNRGWTASNAQQNGVFGHGDWGDPGRWGERKIADIKDGTSNTIMAAEQRLGDHDNGNYKPGDVVRGIPFGSLAPAYPQGGVLYDAAAVAAYGAATLAGIGNHHSHGGREWICAQSSQTAFNTLAAQLAVPHWPELHRVRLDGQPGGLPVAKLPPRWYEPCAGRRLGPLHLRDDRRPELLSAGEPERRHRGG